MMHRFGRAWPVWVVTVALAGACTSGQTEASDEAISELAADAHVIIGDRRMVLPSVAVGEFQRPAASFSLNRREAGRREGGTRRALSLAASNPATAPVLPTLSVRVRPYGWNDFDPSYRRICPQLQRAWAKSVCDDPWAPLAQALPQDGFRLYDRRTPEVFQSHFTVGGERLSDQLAAMGSSSSTSISCDRASSNSSTVFCTAMTPLGGNLAATWSVWESRQGDETHQQKAEREASAIKAFVRYAMGPEEKFDELSKLACRARRPGSVTGPNRVDVCSGI